MDESSEAADQPTAEPPLADQPVDQSMEEQVRLRVRRLSDSRATSLRASLGARLGASARVTHPPVPPRELKPADPHADTQPPGVTEAAPVLSRPSGAESGTTGSDTERATGFAGLSPEALVVEHSVSEESSVFDSHVPLAVASTAAGQGSDGAIGTIGATGAPPSADLCFDGTAADRVSDGAIGTIGATGAPPSTDLCFDEISISPAVLQVVEEPPHVPSSALLGEIASDMETFSASLSTVKVMDDSASSVVISETSAASVVERPVGIQVNKSAAALLMAEARAAPQRRGSKESPRSAKTSPTFAESGLVHAAPRVASVAALKDKPVARPSVIRSIPIDIFKGAPSGLFSAPSSSFDTFAAPPQMHSVDPAIQPRQTVAAKPVPQLSASALPGSLFGSAPSPKKGVSAVDVFSKEPPVPAAVKAASLGLPPAPPGVVPAKSAVSSVAKPKQQVPPARPVVPTPIGMMPTPHGFVPLPASVKVAATVPSVSERESHETQSESSRGPGAIGAIGTIGATGAPPSRVTHFSKPSDVPQQHHQHPAPPGMIPTPHGFVPSQPHTAKTSTPVASSSSASAGFFSQEYAPIHKSIESAPQMSTAPVPKSRLNLRPHCAFVSFGFGGRVALFRPTYDQTFGKGVVKVFRIFDLANASRILPPQLRKLVGSLEKFPGPLKKSDSAVLPEIKEFMQVQASTLEPGSKKLLWQLLELLVDFRGIAHSSELDPKVSIEFRIVDSLLSMGGAATLSADPALPDTLISAAADLRQSHSDIESLLLRGNREEAVDLAINKRDWAMAMLIAGNCRVEVYQNVVKRFADESFPSASPLHFLSLLYSNQADGAIKYGGKKLSAAFSGDDDCFLVNWRRNLAALLSNKTPAWRSLVEGVGNRLLLDAGDVAAAHFTFLCAGELPSAPGSGLLTLVGFNDTPSNLLRAIGSADSACIESFRMTEILEYAINLASSKQTVHTQQAPQGFSFTGLFRSTDQTGSSVAPRDVESIGGISPSQRSSVHNALAPLKLKFAIMICDFGLTQEAWAYVESIRKGISDAQLAPKQSDDATKVHVSKRFIKSLDEFAERLTAKDAPKSAPLVTQHAAPVAQSGSGFFGLGNVLNAIGSSAALKTLVDGNESPARIHSAPSTARPPMQSTNTATPAAFPSVGVQSAYSSINDLRSHEQQQQQQQFARSPAQSSEYGAAQSFSLPSPPNVSSVRSAPAAQSRESANLYSSENSVVAQSSGFQLGAPQQAPSIASMPPTQTQPPQETAPDRRGTDASPATASEQKPSTSESKQSGLVDLMRKGLMKWAYPDAVDATDNLPEGQAVYDDKLKRWIFPGQENEAADDPAISAPPILPPTSSSGSLQSGAADDPLSSLMAPRTVSYSALQSPALNAGPPATGGSYDPLAAMMAPRSHSFSAFQAQTSQSNMPSMMPAVSVWRPPPVAVAPSIPPTIEEDDDSQLVVQNESEMPPSGSYPSIQAVCSNPDLSQLSAGQVAETDAPSSYVVQQSYFPSPVPSNFIEDF